MYQVLQVYTSFIFSLIDDFLSRSIKVGQALSRRRRLRVAETSPQSHGDVAAKSRRRRRNFSSVCLVSVRSLRRSGDVTVVGDNFSRCDFFDNYWRFEKVSKESQKKIRTCLISPRLSHDRSSLQETSRRRLRELRRLESTSSRQLAKPVR